MRRQAGHSAALALVLACVAVIPGAAERTGLRFEVVEHGTGEVVFSQPAAVGDRLHLRHTHSVHKRPVEEIYSVSESWSLALEEMLFDRIGANLPPGPERIGDVTTTFLEQDSGYRVLHHGRELGSVELMVGDHQVMNADGDVRMSLPDATRHGARVELRVRSLATS